MSDTGHSAAQATGAVQTATPETDRASTTLGIGDETVVEASFARRLERQRDELLAALREASAALYNGFEPDNQSRAYKEACAAIARAIGEQP